MKLRDGVAGTKYRRELDEGLTSFEVYVQSRGYVWDQLSSTQVTLIDDLLADWIQKLYNANRRVNVAVCGFLATQRQFRIRHLLQDSWEASRIHWNSAWESAPG